MDFGNTPATKATERIMADLYQQLNKGTDTYNLAYGIIHQHILAIMLVYSLPRKTENV